MCPCVTNSSALSREKAGYDPARAASKLSKDRGEVVSVDDVLGKCAQQGYW